MIGDLGQRHESGAITWVDRKSGFDQIGCPVEVARGARRLAFRQQLRRPRIDLIIRLLPAERGRDTHDRKR